MSDLRPSRRNGGKSVWLRVTSFWPAGLVPVALIISGAVNITNGLHDSLGEFRRASTLAISLRSVGGTGQAVLGGILVLIAVGLFWRLRAVWVFALMVLTMTVAADIARHDRGLGLALAVGTLGLLLFTRSAFDRRTLVANTLVSIVSLVGALIYGIVGTYVLGQGFHPQVKDFTDASYFTFVTLSTVGYGDIVPVSPETKVFAITLILVGLSVFATALASTLGPALSGELSSVLGTRRDKVQAINHIILVGDGLFARVTAQELSRRKTPFVQLLGPNAQPFDPGQTVARSDPDEESGLRHAGIEHARMVVAAHDDDDSRNAFTTLLVKNIDAKMKVIAVASSTRNMRPLEMARADVVFAPALAGGRLLADLAEDTKLPEGFDDLLQRR